MIDKIYSIYDEKSGTYAPPFFSKDDEVAKRVVTSAISSTSTLALYPSDYIIFLLGNINYDTGVIESVGPCPVARLTDVMPVKYRSMALDGSFERSEEDETKKDSPA